MKKLVVLFSVVTIIMGLVFTVPAFAGQVDDVLSENIKKADGTTGQDTNTGSGVKTGHIQDGAVTPLKISFYNNVAIVAKEGGDYGSPIAAMVSLSSWCGVPSETNRCLMKIMPGVYDLQNNYMGLSPYVDIEGSGENSTVITGKDTYVLLGYPSNDLGNVEIRSLTFKCTSGLHGNNAIRIALPNLTNTSVKLTNVTAISSGSYDFNYAIVLDWGDITLANVTADASGGQSAKGIAIGGATNALLTNTSALARDAVSNYGIFMADSVSFLNNITAKAIGGTYNYGVYNQYLNYNSGMVTKIHNSVLVGSTNTLFNGEFSYWEPTTKVANTHLDGGPVTGTGTAICAGVFDENYTFYANTCP